MDRVYNDNYEFVTITLTADEAGTLRYLLMDLELDARTTDFKFVYPEAELLYTLIDSLKIPDE